MFYVCFASEVKRKHTFYECFAVWSVLAMAFSPCLTRKWALWTQRKPAMSTGESTKSTYFAYFVVVVYVCYVVWKLQKHVFYECFVVWRPKNTYFTCFVVWRRPGGPKVCLEEPGRSKGVLRERP